VLKGALFGDLDLHLKKCKRAPSFGDLDLHLKND
jgi:hypothetical protein